MLSENEVYVHTRPSKLLAETQFKVVQSLVDETNLDDYLDKEYEEEFVLLFCTRKSHTNATIAHTSLLLCPVKDKKIIKDEIVNVDGRNYIENGEQKEPFSHIGLKNHLIVGDANGPIMTTAWRRPESILYAFSFAEQLLNLFQKQPELFGNKIHLEEPRHAKAC